MKKVLFLIFLILSSVLFAGCAAKAEENVSYAMGSAVTQKIYGGKSGTAQKAINAISALDSLISYRDGNSAIGRLNSGDTVDDKDVVSLLASSLVLSEETNGVYDVTVLPVVKAWGFDGDGKTYRLPTDEEIKETLGKVGYKNVVVSDGKAHLENGVMCDLSAAGKGEACEKAVEVYKNDGVKGAIVTVGGSVGVYGRKDDGSLFVVGVRDPFDKSGLIGTMTLTDKFISTSGSYEKCFEQNGVNYHHLLDATTGYPAEKGLVSVTVVCDDGGESDSLASACFCAGIESSLPILVSHSAEAVFVTNDGKIYVTPGLENVFEADSFEVIGK